MSIFSRRSITVFLALLTVSAVLLGGCAAAKPGTADPKDETGVANDEYYIRSEGKSSEKGLFGGLAELADGLFGGRDSMMAKDSAAPDGFYDFEEGGMPGDYPDVPGDQTDYSAGQLTGAELRDRRDYEPYAKDMSALLQTLGQDPLIRLNALHRVLVTVKNGDTPVSGVKVQLQNAQGEVIFTAVTDNKGEAGLFYDLLSAGDKPAKVTVEDELTSEFPLVNGDGVDLSVPDEMEVQLNAESPAKKLDLMFMIDTTGSMGDELEYLKNEIKDIIARIYENGSVPVRTSVNFYRDTQDDYILHATPFTDDSDEVYGYIDKERADGGGDMPEAVHTALDSAIHNHQWENDSVKLCFLVLDAPPHSDAEVAESLQQSILDAAAKGVRIIPIVSSGSDSLTEYLMRTYAVLTGGTYTFLTNHSGIGNPHADPTTDTQYSIEKLNDMIVRIATEYCAP